MIPSERRISRRAGAAILIALMVAGLGCVTSGSIAREEDREKNLRRAQSRYNLGVDHLSKGQTAFALRELLFSQELDPTQAAPYFAGAEAYRRQGRMAEAEESLLHAVELAPDFQEARLNLSALYIQLGRYEEAVVEAQMLLDDPTFPALWRALTNKGWAKYKLGEIAEARHALELALEYRPSFWPTLLNLGILEDDVGHHMEALQYFQRVVDGEPGLSMLAEVNYHMGQVYVALGRRRLAVQHFLASAATGERAGAWGDRSEEYLRLLR